MSTVYLAHFGINGMEWGKKNGPPYPLKNAMRSASERKANRESKSSKAMREATIKSKTTKELKDDAERSENEAKYRKNHPVKSDAMTRDTVNQVRSDADTVVRGVSKLIPRRQKDLSQYSDAELQKIVNRQQLEQRYNQLNPDKIDRGAEYIRETLQTAGAVAGLYLTYKTIKSFK